MKREDLTGKSFAYWTVQGDCIRENNARKWLCVCRCGNEKYVNEHNLLTGKSQSCGCLAAERAKERIIDLTGRKFGWLKVVKRAPENQRGRVCWICRCRCGNEVVVTGHELQQQKSKSCGCLKKERTSAADLTNQIFGRLTARRPTDKRDYKGSIIWYCTCKCGGEIEVSQDRLISKNTQSCGCLKKEAQADLPHKLHLIDGTCVEFLEKRKRRSDNTSGHTGVYLKKNGRYRASIGFKGKRFSLGVYATFEEAVEVRKRAEDTLHRAFVKQYYQGIAKGGRSEGKGVPDCELSALITQMAGDTIERSHALTPRTIL